MPEEFLFWEYYLQAAERKGEGADRLEITILLRRKIRIAP